MIHLLYYIGLALVIAFAITSALYLFKPAQKRFMRVNPRPISINSDRQVKSALAAVNPGLYWKPYHLEIKQSDYKVMLPQWDCMSIFYAHNNIPALWLELLRIIKTDFDNPKVCAVTMSAYAFLKGIENQFAKHGIEIVVCEDKKHKPDYFNDTELILFDLVLNTGETLKKARINVQNTLGVNPRSEFILFYNDFIDVWEIDASPKTESLQKYLIKASDLIPVWNRNGKAEMSAALKGLHRARNIPDLVDTYEIEAYVKKLNTIGRREENLFSGLACISETN